MLQDIVFENGLIAISACEILVAIYFVDGESGWAGQQVADRICADHLREIFLKRNGVVAIRAAC